MENSVLKSVLRKKTQITNLYFKLAPGIIDKQCIMYQEEFLFKIIFYDCLFGFYYCFSWIRFV